MTIRRVLAATGLMVTLGGVVAGPCHALDGRGAGTGPSGVPTHLGVTPMLLTDAGAARSEGVLADGARWVISSRVIVRSDAGDLPGRLGGVLKVDPSRVERVQGLQDFWLLRSDTVSQAVASATTLRRLDWISEAYLDCEPPVRVRGVPTDPNLWQQWHLINVLEESDPLFDLNIEPAWCAGLTGAGVVIGVIDEGYATTHPDLAPNHVAEASLTSQGSTSHGTSVAGLIGAAANNGQGGVGVAYGAGIGRLYFFGGASGISDAFLHRNDLIGVKSNSWGPFDIGTITTMSSLERASLETAATTGRGGLGTVFVWAGGNGRQNNDRVDYDPYASSRYTIAVGSIDETDRATQYTEPGACLLVVTPSDRSLSTTADVGIYTTTGVSGYTQNFGGTSASAPMASGVVALLLEANPCLGWRDVQHVLVRTARRNDPADARWSVNGAGRDIHPDYGFGAVDAGAATALAPEWAPVGSEVSATGSDPASVAIPDADPVGVSRSVTLTGDLRIEAVELVLNTVHPRRGDLRIELTSPSGTVSVFSEPRGDGGGNLQNQLFTSVRHWDESSAGTWTLRVADETSGNTGSLTGWTLTARGTALEPQPACRCDLAMPMGTIDVFDLIGYLSLYFDEDSGADWNCNGGVDVFDLTTYLSCWFGACQ